MYTYLCSHARFRTYSVAFGIITLLMAAGCSSSSSSGKSAASISVSPSNSAPTQPSGVPTTVDSMAGMDMSGGPMSTGDTMAPGESIVTTDATSATANGYTLRLDSTTAAAGTQVPLRFSITTNNGKDVLRTYQVEQTKQLHLILVRADLSGYQHLHPTLDSVGHWSIPIDVANPGRWRVIADFTPIEKGTTQARIALGADLQISGSGTDQSPTAPNSKVLVDGFTVEMDASQLKSGASSAVAFTVTRDGAPAIDIQPYLGAFGHLVAIRATDLAYLHVHPLGEPAVDGTVSGPKIVFDADIPNSGLHALYLQFETNSVVHTATFSVDVA
jgi:hypothetical protein